MGVHNHGKYLLLKSGVTTSVPQQPAASPNKVVKTQSAFLNRTDSAPRGGDDDEDAGLLPDVTHKPSSPVGLNKLKDRLKSINLERLEVEEQIAGYHGALYFPGQSGVKSSPSRRKRPGSSSRMGG